MQIEFASDKDAANQAKHRISLAFGARVLADANRLDVLDVRFDYAEERFVSYGMVDGRIWVCVFTPRGDTSRVIRALLTNTEPLRRPHWFFGEEAGPPRCGRIARAG